MDFDFDYDVSDGEVTETENQNTAEGTPSIKRARKSRSKKITTADVTKIISDGGSRVNLSANLVLSPMFDLLKDKDGKQIALLCKECDTAFGLRSTTAATLHVQAKHPTQLDLIKRSGDSIKTKLADLFADLSIATQVPFAFFENPAFLHAMEQFAMMISKLDQKEQTFNSGDLMPTARTISEHATQVARKARSELVPFVVEKLMAGSGALTLDLATSKKEIIAITAHTISETQDENGQTLFNLESNILELASWDITKRTTKAEIRSFLVNILTDLGFKRAFFEKIYIVTDEGSSVVNLNNHSICCISHILNTVAKRAVEPYKRIQYDDDLESDAKSFDQLISNVTNFFSLARRNIALRAVLGDITAVPAKTRWLGHLQSLNNFLQHTEQISNCLDNDLYAASNLKAPFNLLMSQKVIIESLVKVLEAIKKPLVKLQADSLPTINHVIPALAQLEKTLTTFKEANDSSKELVSISSLVLIALETKLKKIREIDAYSVGIVLDPYLNKLLPNICETTKWDLAKIKQQVENAAHSLLTAEPHIIEELQKQKQDNVVDDYGFADTNLTATFNVSTEIENILSYRTSMPLLKFWTTCGDEFPILKVLACRYLCIPATSASSERVFSQVKLYDTRLRSRLNMEKINEMVLARNWLKKMCPTYFDE